MLVRHVDLRSGAQLLLSIQTSDVMWVITDFPFHYPFSFQVVLPMHTYMYYHKYKTQICATVTFYQEVFYYVSSSYFFQLKV